MTQISESASSVQVNNAPLTTAVSMENSPLLTSEIDSRIVKIRPVATPIDQMSRCGDVRHVGSMKVNYYMADVKDVSTELASDAAASDYTKNGGDTYGVLRLKVKNPNIFSLTETVLLPGVTVDGSAVTLYVKDIDADGIVGYLVNDVRSFNTQVLPKLKQGEKVVRMGRAAGELDVQTPQFETLPKRNENYCQIFKMQVEESTLHKLSNKEAQWGFSDQEEVAIIDMRQGMEKNFIFGTKCMVPGIENGSDDVYLTGGIWNQEGLSQFEYDSEGLTEETLISLCRESFTGGKGSSRKILMGGSDFIEKLSGIECHRVVVGAQTTVRWGLEFREIKSNFGTLYVIHNEIFDQCGHGFDAMVIDPNMITKYVHIPFSTERLDLRTAGTRNTEAVVITEASCLVLRNPACHLKVVAKPKTV